MIRVGIVGLGFMGRMHYRCWSAVPGAKITAVCEANAQVLEAAGKPQAGNVAGAAERIDLESLEVFGNIDDLVASRSVDAVSITLPTFLHADATVKALEGGLHVLCEKPMALTVEECDRMVDAARASGKQLQIGHCIRFWPEYVATRELIRDGRYGNVVAASFRRFAAMPGWSPDSWFADEKRSGGQPLDLHIHDTDYIHSLFGMPSRVSSSADPSQSYISTQYSYPDGPIVVAESSWRMAQGWGFEMSFVAILEKATIAYDLTRAPAFRVLPAEGAPYTPELPPGDGYSREVEHFARVLNGETVESIITPEEARETIRLVLAEKQSARERKAIDL
jgi:1,5-anhydro-D-fructose reductase (1,5-anhydro-D-mannitol-forming)